MAIANSGDLLRLMGTMGLNNPDEFAALLANTGFVAPPAGGPVGPALGELAQPAVPATPPPPPAPTQAEIAESQGAMEMAMGETQAGPFAVPEAAPPGGSFLKALAALEMPAAPQAPRVPNLSGNVPRPGGTIDPRQLQALLQLLNTGQGGAPSIPALGGLIPR